MRAITDRYRAEWAALDNPPHDLPLMGVGRHIVIAETRKEALEIAKRGYHKWRESFLVLWHKHNMLPSPHAIFPEQFEQAEAQGRAVAGTADHVRAFVRTPSTKAVWTTCYAASHSRHHPRRGPPIRATLHPPRHAGNHRRPGASLMQPEYEVFALRYGTREARRHEHFIGGDPHDGPMPMDYFVWLARTPTER